MKLVWSGPTPSPPHSRTYVGVRGAAGAGGAVHARRTRQPRRRPGVRKIAPGGVLGWTVDQMEPVLVLRPNGRERTRRRGRPIMGRLLSGALSGRARRCPVGRGEAVGQLAAPQGALCVPGGPGARAGSSEGRASDSAVSVGRGRFAT